MKGLRWEVSRFIFRKTNLLIKGELQIPTRKDDVKDASEEPRMRSIQCVERENVASC